MSQELGEPERVSVIVFIYFSTLVRLADCNSLLYQ
jgi:hypothetical protein